MKKAKSSSKFNYEENLSTLLREVTHYKHTYFKKETRNIIKMKHFLAYFESCHNSFMNTPLNLIWCFNFLTKKFLEDISQLTYEEIIPLIIQLLCGDFKNTVKKKKMVDLRIEKQKLISFYLLPLNKKSNQNILFALCFKGAKLPSSTMHFLSISTNWNFEETAQDFLEQINSDDNFPIVDFDKNGIYLVDEILFSHKEIDPISKITICFPLKNIDIRENKIFRRTKYDNECNDPNDFKNNKLNETIISQIEDNQYETLIISAIEGAFWDYKLSLQEKKYVKNSDSFILSGRPGTGKTTVLLFKLFSIYFNYVLKKKHNEKPKNENNKDIIINENNKNNKNNSYNTNNFIGFNLIQLSKKPTDSLRVVFTSLSQHLCERQQNIFEQTMVRKMENNYNNNNDKSEDKLDLKYSPLTNNELRQISNFRQLYKYPIFANFRKIMFMIDGSLTFQFFSRIRLQIYEGDHDTEYYYSKDYEYDVNEYTFNYSTKYMNFFYRSPNCSKKEIKLKEANETTFLTFYNNFLSKRKKIPLAQTLFILNLNPLEIYAQLISIIKGSYSSHLYMNNCISKEDYKTKGRKITDLPNLDEIYDVCMLYEEYKKNNNYFDIQDLVNFLIRQVKLELKNVKLIDYLFIDEIQDLTISQIYLLVLVSEHCKIYAGDTCQTISKINRFRFSELSNIFYAFSKIIPNYQKVTNAYLCLNYRLNSKILRLSTFMAYLMKILFPNTIDKFQDDFSIKIIEQKPIHLNNIDLIINRITNNNNKNNNTDYTLTANHCFIYHDEKDCEQLTQRYGENIFKLNVAQSKGLEFEMVIVYNFFSSSKFQGLWDKIFRNIKVVINESINSSAKVQLGNILYQENMNYLVETLHLRSIYNILSDNQIQNKIIKELDDFVYPELDMKFDKHEIFEFCSELKQFYVIITRPKTFLVFYENNLNHSRDGFYRLMESNNAKLVIREDNMNNSQQQFLTNVNNYFREINLIVRTPDELRILGNDEFNEGHYFLANYLYRIGKNKILATISEIFYNQETIEEKINYENSNNTELIRLSKKIFEDTSYILNEHEEKKLINIIEKDDNIININYILEKIIIFKGKSLIILELYDDAIELYIKYKKKKELGMIYLEYKNEYIKAFEIFDSIDNYKYALESLNRLKDYQKIFNYINLEKVALYFGIIEYNKVYTEYTNKYFRRYFIIERSKINEKNFTSFIENKIKEDGSNKNIINNFFIIYLNHIKNFQIQSRGINIIEENYVDFSEEKLDEIKDDIDLKEDTIHIIKSYYFNILKNILIELIKIYPELVICNKKLNNIKIASKHFKRQLFPNLLLYKGRLYLNYNFKTQSKIFDEAEELYKNLDIIIEYLLKNSNYDKDKFIKYIFPFIINNGYFYYKLDKYFPEKEDEIKFFFDMSLNNYENLWDENVITRYEETFLKNKDYLLYYLSYIIRIGITEFILYKNGYILDNLLFKKYHDFQRLKNLTSNLKVNSIKSKNFEKNIKIFLDYLLYSKEEEITIGKMIELFDIGSSLSLLLITIYFNNNNYGYDLVLNKDSLLELYQNLYKLCNIISSSNCHKIYFNHILG